MAKYITQKSGMSDLLQKRAEERQRKFAEEKYAAQGSKPTVSNLAQSEVKDVARDIINTTEKQQVSSATDALQKLAGRGKQPTETLNYNQLKREFFQKQKLIDAQDKAMRAGKQTMGKAGLGGLAALGAVGASMLPSSDAAAAEPDYVQGGLGLAALADPTGVSDAASEVYRRTQMAPAEREAARKMDYRENLQDRVPGISEFELDEMGYEDGGAIRKQLLKKLAGR